MSKPPHYKKDKENQIKSSNYQLKFGDCSKLKGSKNHSNQKPNPPEEKKSSSLFESNLSTLKEYIKVREDQMNAPLRSSMVRSNACNLSKQENSLNHSDVLKELKNNKKRLLERANVLEEVIESTTKERSRVHPKPLCEMTKSYTLEGKNSDSNYTLKAANSFLDSTGEIFRQGELKERNVSRTEQSDIKRELSKFKKETKKIDSLRKKYETLIFKLESQINLQQQKESDLCKRIKEVEKNYKKRSLEQAHKHKQELSKKDAVIASLNEIILNKSAEIAEVRRALNEKIELLMGNEEILRGDNFDLQQELQIVLDNMGSQQEQIYKSCNSEDDLAVTNDSIASIVSFRDYHKFEDNEEDDNIRNQGKFKLQIDHNQFVFDFNLEYQRHINFLNKNKDLYSKIIEPNGEERLVYVNGMEQIFEVDSNAIIWVSIL